MSKKTTAARVPAAESKTAPVEQVLAEVEELRRQVLQADQASLDYPDEFSDETQNSLYWLRRFGLLAVSLTSGLADGRLRSCSATELRAMVETLESILFGSANTFGFLTKLEFREELEDFARSQPAPPQADPEVERSVAAFVRDLEEISRRCYRFAADLCSGLLRKAGATMVLEFSGQVDSDLRMLGCHLDGIAAAGHGLESRTLHDCLAAWTQSGKTSTSAETPPPLPKMEPPTTLPVQLQDLANDLQRVAQLSNEFAHGLKTQSLRGIGKELLAGLCYQLESWCHTVRQDLSRPEYEQAVHQWIAR